MTTHRDQVLALMFDAQTALVRAFEECDGESRFTPHAWERPGGGDGWARILEGGAVFERAGVNVSAVHGEQVPAAITDRQDIDPGAGFFATGLSTVLHPRNPWVPAFHANFRYFEVGEGREVWWFGGGADLTPSYGFEEDARHLHRTLKDCCDTFDPDFYARAKKSCDEYFYLPHREETRGVGGIFFDRMHPEGPDGWERAYGFVERGLNSLVPAYLPIVRQRVQTVYGERERQWQLLRRGRYAEFNLIHDRGTRFGLESRGNTEAVLMALPPLASWSFGVVPRPGSEEERLAEFLRPRDWLTA
ncbi:oxygen-dependent coproporphyrinogen oxidase [Streptomyces sp. NPDC050508]|uniref:oxygen-dependent coproporphyrinogen oxidase n=1 Tax=Streptomyces sp. NPDC050508 TaxID=3155405 RepID=UPI003444D940